MSGMVNKWKKKLRDKSWGKELALGIQNRRDERKSSDSNEGEDMYESRCCSNYARTHPPTHTHTIHNTMPSHSPA